MAKEETLEAESAPTGREAASALAAHLLSILVDAVCNAEGNKQGIFIIVVDSAEQAVWRIIHVTVLSCSRRKTDKF